MEGRWFEFYDYKDRRWKRRVDELVQDPAYPNETLRQWLSAMGIATRDVPQFRAA